MAFNRAHLYNVRDQKVSFYGNAIAHPARVQIIHQLTDEEFMSVESLKAFHPIAMSTVSQHMEILREKQLVDFKEEFPFIFYNLNQKNIACLKRELRQFLDRI